MNKVILVGRISSDIELRYTSNNIPVATFSLAVNRQHTNQNGEREADFINIVVWRKPAENVKDYMSKGSRIGVEGSIQTRSYEDNNGNKRYVTEVVSSNIEFLESKKGTTQTETPPAESTAENEPNGEPEKNPFEEFGEQISIDPDELPFD